MNKCNIANPKVFISYSWDSDEHRNRVKSLVLKLRSDDINVVYDGDIKLGDRVTKFMEKSLIECDIVLFICTPQYKQKADKRIAGVGYENNIITAELYETQCENKFIPVLFEGTWKESVPAWAKGKIGIDLTNPSKYDDEYERLLQELTSTNDNGVEFLYRGSYDICIGNNNCKEKIDDEELNLDEQFNERFTEIFGVDEGIINVNQEASKVENHSTINDIVKHHIIENMKNGCKESKMKEKMFFCPRDPDEVLADFILFQEQGDVKAKETCKNFSLIDNCNASTIIYEVIEKPDVITKRYHLYAERVFRSSKPLLDGRVLRTFYIDKCKEEEKSIILLSFSNSFIMINTGMLIDNEVRVSDPLMLEMNKVVLDRDVPFIIRCQKEFMKDKKIRTFTADQNSNYIVIDNETQEEVKRKMCYDSEHDKWMCSIDLKVDHSYFTFQIRSKDGYEMNNMQIATSYERGDGDFPVNILEALKYYELAECPEADYHIGLIFLRDNECHNVEEGLRYLCKAANADYIPAMVSLASQYLCGKYYKQDLEKTYYWWERAVAAINCAEKSQYGRLERYFDILNIIADNLYDKEIIDEPVYLKYEKPDL